MCQVWLMVYSCQISIEKGWKAWIFKLPAEILSTILFFMPAFILVKPIIQHSKNLWYFTLFHPLGSIHYSTMPVRTILFHYEASFMGSRTHSWILKACLWLSLKPEYHAQPLIQVPQFGQRTLWLLGRGTPSNTAGNGEAAVEGRPLSVNPKSVSAYNLMNMKFQDLQYWSQGEYQGPSQILALTSEEASKSFCGFHERIDSEGVT